MLLEANPLEDITNTRQIRAVILDERFLDREALDELLTEAEQSAKATFQSGVRGEQGGG